MKYCIKNNIRKTDIEKPEESRKIYLKFFIPDKLTYGYKRVAFDIESYGDNFDYDS